MRATPRHSRSGRLMLVLGLVLLTLFAALVAIMKVHTTFTRFLSNEDLLAELADAEFVDEPPPSGQNWPQWRGSRRDGVTTMTNLPRAWPRSGLPRLWRKASADTYSSLAVVGDRVYTMLGMDSSEAVVCWNLETGQEYWRQAFHRREQFQYGGPRATPTVEGDRLYAASAAGLLMCLNIHNGDVVWRRDLVKELGAVPPRWGFAYSPLIEGDLVFITAGGTRARCLAAFDKTSGDLVWARESDPPGYSSPIAATIDGVRQVIYFTGKRLLGVRPESGEVLWDFSWLTQFEVNAATPLLFRTRRGKQENTYVFITSGYDRGCALVKIGRDEKGSRFLARRVYESDEMCCHFSTPVRYKDHLYGLDEKRDLTCLNLRTGEVAWRFERAEGGEDDDASRLRSVGFKKGSLIRVDDLLVVLGEDGKLALVEASPTAYRELTAIRAFRDRCWTLPVLANGRLLVRDRRNLLCLDVRPKSAKN